MIVGRIELAQDSAQWETCLDFSEHNGEFPASLEADTFLAS